MRKYIHLVLIMLLVGVVSGQAQSLVIKKRIVNTLVVERQLTRAWVNERGGVNKVLTVKSIDLNGDGKSEFTVDCACVDMSAVYVFRKTGNDMRIIYWGTQRETIRPKKSKTNGWRDLRSTVYRSVDGALASETLRWNGSEYK